MGQSTSVRLIDILLVEDNPADVRLARETLKDYRMLNSVHIVENGEDALAYLRREGKYQNATLPDLVLLDINLPRMDGIEVMQELSADGSISTIPIVVLTTSLYQKEIVERFKLPVECYITKPLTLDRFLEAVRCFPHLGISITTVATA